MVQRCPLVIPFLMYSTRGRAFHLLSRTRPTRFPRNSATHSLTNTVETATPVDWDDRIALQKSWSNSEKGWKVDVEWKMTPFGVGLFAAQDIVAGTILRTGVIGCNLKELSSIEHIEEFCQSGREDEYYARLRYVADYLWGFTVSGTDKEGYCDAHHQDERHRFFGAWVPGNGLNHSPRPNTVYRTTPRGIDLVALTDVMSGDELYDDYRRHGQAPKWLADFARQKQLTLNFAECNDFVNPKD